MSQYVETPTRAFAAAAIRAQFLRVYLSTGTLTTAGAANPSIGTQEIASVAATDVVPVRLRTAQGTRKCVASEAITAGASVYAAASGKVASSGTIIEGIALEAATANNDVIEVMDIPNTDVAAAITGTTAAAFEVDSDSATPKLAVSGDSAGTGDFTTTLKPEATLSADNTIRVPEANGDTLVAVALAQTLTSKTLTSPTINAGALSGTFTGNPTLSGNPVLSGNPDFTGDPKGVPVTKIVPFIENATNTLHTGTVPIPAGATLVNIQVVNTVLWGATSASLDVGDDNDADGYFQTVDCKATDLAVGEVLDISNAENWGATNGAYLVAATGRKGGVQAGNSGPYYGVANNIIGVMTVGTPAATTGRTFMIVTYTVGETIAAVASGP